jgi:tape measure domain-containing protein
MVAITADKVVVELEAKLGQYNANVKGASQTWERSMSDIRRSGSSTEKEVTRAFGAIAASIFTAATLKASQQLIDSSTRIANALKVAGLEGESFSNVYKNLYESAQRNAVPLEALVTLYGRVALVQKELGITSEHLTGFSDKIAVALRVSGKSAAESSGALLQLSQALGSGIVRAEEFNSVLEGALPIAQAAAAGLEEAGGSVARLRQLVIEGKVSSQAFFKAFEAGSVILDEKVAKSQFTVEQGFTRLANAAINAAGKFDQAYGASGKVTSGLDALADAVTNVGEQFGNQQSSLNRFLDRVIAVSDGIWELRRRLINFATLGLLGEKPTPSGPSNPVGSNQIAPRPPSAVSTVSISDFPTDGKGGLSAAAKAAAKAAAADAKIIADLVEQIKNFGNARQGAIDSALGSLSKSATAETRAEVEKLTGALFDLALQAKTAELSQDNAGLEKIIAAYNENAEAVKRVTAEIELENEARQNNIDLDSEEGRIWAERKRRNIDLAQTIDDLKAKTEETKNFTRDLGQALNSAFEDAVLSGGSLGDIFQGLLQDIARLILRAYVLSSVMQTIGIGSNGLITGGGIIGGVGSLLGFASGTPNTGGARGEPRGVVHGQEAVIPLPSGGKVPVEIRLPPALKAGGGGMGQINVQTIVNVTDGRAETQTRGSTDRIGRELAVQLEQAVRGVMQREKRQGGLLWNQGVR